MIYKIVIVDDHLLIAKAIAGIINTYERYNVIYEVEHGKALMNKFENPENIPHVVLLDISMPVMNGFETAAWLRDNHPNVLVLALSMQDDDLSLIKMIRAGAKGYLLKNIHPDELQKALDELTTKGIYYQEWANRLVPGNEEFTQSSRTPQIYKLTEKETDFLKYCCTELTYKEIGEKMGVSNRTVEGYRDVLFQKIGAKTRVGLAMHAIKTGIIEL